ncbi:MAG: hypothetical protein ACHBMF_07820 [Chromatiales bacterium]
MSHDTVKHQLQVVDRSRSKALACVIARTLPERSIRDAELMAHLLWIGQ